MFWQHKRPLVICFISVILIGLGVLGLFTFAQVKTLYAKFTGDHITETTEITNVYTVVDTNGTTTTQVNNSSTVSNNTTTSITNANSTNTTLTNATATAKNQNTNSTGTTSIANKTTETAKKNSTEVKKHHHMTILSHTKVN